MIDFENIQTRSTLQPKIKEISFTACKCNGWSNRCGFNEEYFHATGSGGECINCEGNRDGQHCERCLPDHYESPEQDHLNRTSCLACNCDPTGMYYIIHIYILTFLMLTIHMQSSASLTLCLLFYMFRINHYTMWS